MFASFVVVLGFIFVLASASLNPEITFSGEIKLMDPAHHPLGPLTEGETVSIYPNISVPRSWDYRPRGLMTIDLNQHIPVYWYGK